MALNIKAAVLICALCILCTSWLVQRADVRHAALPSPLGGTEAAGSVTVPAWLPRPDQIRLAGERDELVRRLGRPNAMDQQAEAARSVDPALAVVLSGESGEADLPLPPLARPAVPLEEAEVYAEGDAAEPIVLAADVTPEAPPPAPGADTARPYRVARGETLTKVLQRELQTSDPRVLRVVLDANPKVKARGGRLQCGETLLLPDGPAAALRAAAGLSAIAGGGGTEEPRWYTIRRNDSLKGIARRHLDDAGRWPEILKLNRSLKPERLIPGARIKLPPAVRVARG